ncbi:tetratricopeptide repeat protein [Flavobacterium johnsoniae]|uniref:tetratricopeptide repeat protein n=1 Tax=Flavobacterium johnsoniae TaxID=986 RepID=UPI0011ECC124
MTIEFYKQKLNQISCRQYIIKKRKDLLVTDYLVKGQSFESQSKLDKALEYYEKALKTDPNSPYPLQNIGFYYYKAGQDKKAISYLLNALKYPGLYDGKTEFFIGICYLREQDKANACKYFNIAKNKKYSQVNQSILQSCK